MAVQTTPLKLNSPTEVLAIVPYLLGFHPRESLVVLVCDEGHVAVTARLDLDDLATPVNLRFRFEPIMKQYEKARLVAIAFSDDPFWAATRMEIAHEAFGEYLVFTVIASQDRFWCGDSRQIFHFDDPGELYDETSSLAAATAVVLGLSAYDSREQLCELIRPPEQEKLETVRMMIAENRQAWLSGDALLRADELVAQLRTDLTDTRALVELGVLVSRVDVRDYLWLQFRRESATHDLELWLAVVRVLPVECSVPALCLAGIAAWLIGNGALQVVCLEQGQSIDRKYSLLSLLEDINVSAAPPSVWDHLVNER